MKRILVTCLVLAAVLAVIPSVQAATPPGVGQQLPDFELPLPKDGAERSYLGLSKRLFSFGGGSFRVPEIKAQAVVFQVFSMYCPHCQKDAPNMNAFYHLVNGSQRARDRVKIIGVGAGNNPYEVGVFKKKYQVPFPLFADADFVIHKKLGDVRTPYFIVIRIMPDGSHRVVYSKLGSFGDPARFLDAVLTMSGI
ncbi:MAG: peroxiredoxin family protein [Geobacter sp.]|jgi:peroxiredoxin|uniref:peroxiredoxin family protein n=1 Tax=Trichlorobacter sp. TaxID=2911007 RepID=UPI002A36EF0C|nr:TlpA disulfide reductase family protein [Trichlorobacter sp.]MDY0384254.1 TlpA disulfide reductase family protein [Trichlorobacter sp.]